jgi:hypothetical protein
VPEARFALEATFAESGLTTSTAGLAFGEIAALSERVTIRETARRRTIVVGREVHGDASKLG